MGLSLQVVCLVVKLFAIAIALVVQGSAGLVSQPAPVLAPLKSVPMPQMIKGVVSSPSPIPPTLLPPYNSVSPSLTIHGIVPSLPPSAPQRKDQEYKNLVSVPAALAPLASPVTQPIKGIVPSLSSSTPLVLPPYSSSPPLYVHGIVPSLPPSTPQKKDLKNKNPISAPAAPVPVASPIPQRVEGIVPSPSPSTSTVLPPYGSVLHPPTVHGIVPSPPPSVPQKEKPINKNPVLAPVAPHSSVPPDFNVRGIVPSLPPSVPQRESPNTKNPVSVPVAPVSSSSNKSPQKPPTIHPIIPGSMPPSSHENKAPVPNASTSKKMPENPPPFAQPIMPGVPPYIFPVPVALPPSKLLPNSPTIQPIIPKEPPSNLPESGVSAVSPSPITNRKGGPIATPPNVTPHQFSPWKPSPNKEPGVSPISPPQTTNQKSDGVPIAAPPNETPHQFSPWKPSPNKEPGVSPVSPPPITNRKSDGVPIAAPPNETPHQFSPWNPSPNKEPGVSPVSPPQITNRKSDGVPISAPPNETPHQFSPWNPSPNKAPSMHKSLKHSNSTASPLSSPKAPYTGSHSPASLPSTSFHKHRNATVNITNPAPSPLFLPPTSSHQGPYIAPAPSHAFSIHPNTEQPDHAPPPRNPESHISPEPSAYPKAPSGQSILPFLAPKISPSGSSPRNPNRPDSPPIEVLPPPPPNEDCLSVACVEPLTNPPPGSACDCVLPMQVGLRLNVALYTFFPLVSELAEEIAVGVFMKQSQVRIMGANATSQDPEKTIVLANLVPLGEKFDYTTAYLTFQRFWHKQVEINNSLFGDYDVLYVYYPGLPPSPPSNTNGGLDSDRGNNGATLHPLGVDVKKRRHKAGLNRSFIAIIVLSASMAVILCCAVAWVWLFKHRDCQRESTSLATLPSLPKPSGTAASMIGSGPSSVSLSFESSFATYAGSAKTFSASDIERATDNFNASRVLGEGGFGCVYSGVLEDGTRVAVKVLKRDDRQGGREFLAEVEMLSRLHHRNLVKLIGICTEKRSRCLVYELIPNGSVESHLHGIDKETAPLDWGARIKIALGAARGLAYLHEDSSPRVIHRDFKSSNILLEHDFTPKVSDFGLARTALDEENRHISTRVMGTFGYVAPEYAMTGHLLVKSDVYSYGVVLLELLTGRKPVDMSQPPGQENLVAWARPLLTSKEGLESIIDPSLGPNFPFDSIAKVAAIASMCAQPEVSHRPFMGEVVQALKLICNESEETRESRCRSCSQEHLSIDMDAEVVSTNSGQLRDPLQAASPVSNYNSGIDVERGLPVSDLFSSAALLGGQESWSFRRHSSSGSLRTGRGRHLWEKIRSLSSGTASEHRMPFSCGPDLTEFS